MRPNLTSINLALGRIEEIERKTRSISGVDQNSKPAAPRFVDVLKEAEKAEKNTAKIPGKAETQMPQKTTSSTTGSRSPGSGNAIDKSEFDQYITKYAAEFGVDEKLVRAVIKAESAFNPNVQSNKGAMGLMQLMPGTARMLGVDDPWDPEQNIRGGVKYLAGLSDTFDGDVEKMLAGYNAGPQRVVQYGGIPPFKETQDYVKKIMGWLNK